MSAAVLRHGYDDLRHGYDDARAAIGRIDLHLHDLRHTGLTPSAASSATVAELMRRGGHSSPTAAIRYQHATADSGRILAHALEGLRTAGEVVSLSHSRRTREEWAGEGSGGPVAEAESGP